MTTTRHPRDAEAGEAAVFDTVRQYMVRVEERAGTCPPPDRVLQAQAAPEPDADERLVLAHLSLCPICQDLVEALGGAVDGGPSPAERRRIDARVAQATAVPVTRRPSPPLAFGWRWAAVAALAAAAGLTIVLHPGASLGPATLPAIEPPPELATGRPPARTILLAERLETAGMGLAAVSWRGDAQGVPPPSAFDAARLAFDRGEYAEAERRLVALATSTPEFGDAWLLLGVSRLLSGRSADAIVPLERAHQTLVGEARRDAAWHLAVALHSTGRDADARALLSPMCAERTPRAGMACLALDELRGP